MNVVLFLLVVLAVIAMVAPVLLRKRASAAGDTRAFGVKKGFNFHEWNNRINRMSYDFLVCAKDSTVLVAIELDDKTHDTVARAAADARRRGRRWPLGSA